MYTVRLTNPSKKDFKKLDGHQKQHVLKGFKKIEQLGLSAGEQLSGDLHKCRKIKMKSQGLRIIFRQNKSHVEIMQIVAIGERDKQKVYKDALKRLDDES